MGLVFIIPFVWFFIKGWIPGWLSRRLGWVILLAAAQATMGWIMVKSGLNDDTRTWVSAYKLVYHLSLATILLGILYNTYLHAQYGSQPKDFVPLMMIRLLPKRRPLIDANRLRWIYGRNACGTDS